MRQNFEVHKNTRNLVIYDYNSVMHYSKNAFSKFQYLPAIEVCIIIYYTPVGFFCSTPPLSDLST